MKLNFFSLETMFKRIFRYLLKRYFGQYLVDFSQDELTYGLSHGKGSVENVQLNIEALNELSEEYNLPIEFLHGSIDFVSILVPWTSLLCENTIIEVRGLKLVVHPKERPQDVSMFDSMWGSMTSSLQLAEECLNSNEDEEEIEVPDRSEGLEKIAKTIDAVLANMKIRFQNSNLKIQHILPNHATGISLEIKIASSEYFDEAGVNAPQSGYSLEKDRPSYEPSAYSFKRVIFEGVSLFTAEFKPEEKTFIPAPSMYRMDDPNHSILMPGSPEMPPTHCALIVKKTEPSCNKDPVLISKLNGQQELRLKLKQNEAVIGPKVDVEFNFGAFNLFLTPQQVHLLLTLMNGLIKPTDTNPSKKEQQSLTNKPMRPADYALVQQELLRQQQNPEILSKSLKNHQGWSSQFFDESDEDFHLMTMENKACDNGPPSISSQDDMASSINSDARSDSTSNSAFTPKTKRGSSVQGVSNDPLSELTHFHGCLSSLLIIILHDDSVQENFTKDAKSDSVSLKVQAETFFADLLDLQMSGFNFKDFPSVREPISKLCETNHLRLLASGVVLDGNETSSSTERILKFNVSFHQFEVLECLFNCPAAANEKQVPKYMQLLTFNKKDTASPEQRESCVKISYSQVEYTSQNRLKQPPANKLDIEFGVMSCDVDISLTDRIRTLLNFSNVSNHTDSTWDHWNDVTMGPQASSKTEISISISSLTVNLRFPIPDLHSIHDMERTPWWQQNIHKETLILVFQSLTFNTLYDESEKQAKYTIQCQDVHGLFKMSDSEEAISFLRISVDPDLDEVSRNSGFDWPRVVISRMTKIASSDLERENEDSDDMQSCSLSYALIHNLVNEPSPFCTTSVIHDGKETNPNLSAAHDEIIKPSDKDSMLNFINQTVKKCECEFEFSLRAISVVFPNRDFFELLINRISSDLLLWENTSLSSTNAFDASTGFSVHITGLENFPKSQGYDPDPEFKSFSSDSNSDSEDEGNMHMSVHQFTQRHKQKHKKKNDAGFTKCSFKFSITKGSLLVAAPIVNENEILPDVAGKLKLYVEDSLIFMASCYKGDPNEMYMCLLAEKSALYHEGSKPVEKLHPVVQPLNNSIKDSLKCIIYESDPGMHLNPVYAGNFTKEMLKFAVHAVKNPKQQIKTFKVAVELSGGTLQHYVLPSSQLWINQMMGFLKIATFPVKGYTPPAVVTELHLNLSNCAIDYRPLKLPFRTALTVENFNMSCNVTAMTPSFIFRIISEELRFFISANIEARRVELKKNYVCAVDTGLIDISIKTSVDEKQNPKLEMSISNNKVHLRTCADSFKAILDLMNYFSCNGDLETNSNISEMNENIKSCVKSKSIDSQSQNLDVLMAEAMKECTIAVNGNEDNLSNSDHAYDYSNTDDEFCILEDDPGIGLIPRNGEPQIRLLTDEPIKIVENHFSVPPGKSDVLKAPKHFPNPLFQLTLQQMSLVWHLYGGSDFKKGNIKKNMELKNGNSKSRQEVRFADQSCADREYVAFCNVTPMSQNCDPHFVQFSMENVTINQNQGTTSHKSWLHKGGPGRNHDVLMELQMNKVQYQREIYPLDNEYASRYILLIHDIEIRDRLAVSQINKFLYQYATKDLPRQSHANMIEVKATYTRPDPKRTTEECALRLSSKPLRLNVDQDSLMFLVDFFQEVLDVPTKESEDVESNDENKPPINLNQGSNMNNYQNESLRNETFYRSFLFSPDVLIRIDYHGKRVQMEQGALKGLIMGLGQLNASEIKLKRLCYRHGLLGHGKLFNYALKEWQQDILKNQLPSLLGGVGPMHSFVQLIQGVKDLFYLPVAQYQRDGQIVRGLQRGASSFSTSTVIAALDLTSRFFYAVQGTAEIAFDMVSPGPSVSGKSQRSQEKYKKNSQPADIIEGVATAYNVVKEGLEDTARTIYRVASTEHEHKGVPGAVGGVLRQIPPSLFKPIILGSEATSYLLDGVRHQLMPDAHQEDIHKWRSKNN